jgi:AcrR family transcriptional regulator
MGLRDAKINFLVNVATDLFISRSIQDVTMKDIAVAAQVGEATLYRYFGKKQTLVMQVALKLRGLITSDYFRLDQMEVGYGQIEIFYMSYLEIFKEHRELYKFIREFDMYMRGEDKDSLNQYEAAISLFRTEYIKAYKLGVKDGSIKPQEDIEMFYFSTTHALLELCKKLAMKEVLNQDKTIDKEKEIKCLIDLFLKSIKNY